MKTNEENSTDNNRLQRLSSLEAYVNGVHVKTLLLVPKEQKTPRPLYYALKNTTQVAVDDYDFESVEALIHKFHNEYSIIFDSRLQYLILVAHRIFPNYVLVFDVDSSRKVDVHDFLASRHMFDVRGVFIWTPEANKLIDLYIFIRFFCSNIGIKWNNIKAFEVIHHNNWLEMIMNYIGVYKYEQTDRTRELLSRTKEIIDEQFRCFMTPYISKDELFTVLVDMRAAEIYGIRY